MTNKLRLLGCTAAMMTLAACATTSTPATTSTSAQVASAQTVESQETTAVASADANEMVCKRQKVIGSNFKKKVCATQAQWDLAAQQSRDATENMQRSGTSVTPGG